jgi:tRNA/rRNA methyltransferase
MALENIEIILLGTKHPGNIGSVARAMFNMGLDRLILASPQCEINEESYRLAKAGKGVLDAAQICSNLKNALHSVRFLIGTTGKSGGYRAPAHSLRSSLPRILNQAAEQKIGILFGPEDTGLVDEDLQLCQLLVRIPTRHRANSINLAQAVMIVSYELWTGSLGRDPQRVPKLASLEQIEAMYVQLEEALLKIGFLQDQNSRHMMLRLRQLFGRAGLESSDVGILRGIARQINWFSSEQ